MSYKISSPGSVMILGEYAVLKGHQALVAATDQRLTTTLHPRDDEYIEIISSLGTFKKTLKEIEIIPPFQFVLGVIKKYQANFFKGCTLLIESSFSHTVGLASSAAVTVATLKAITMWLGFSLSEKELILEAREIVQSVQGTGSGADVAACALGGLVAYRMDPFSIEKMENIPEVTVIYSGSETPTKDAIKKVEHSFKEYPILFNAMLQAIGQCSEEGIIASKNNDWKRLGNIMNVQQGLMDALGVNTPCLQKMIETLRKEPQILGAKISGSGLGDCVIGLGKILQYDGDILPVSLSSSGVVCEKI